MQNDPARAVLSAARRAARAADEPLLLAISGGLDSMALLRAMAVAARGRIAAVATFDHGTGAAATRAVREVSKSAAALGLPTVVGRIAATIVAAEGREAAWRDARHRFLRETAATLGARVVTAHTEDDQIETVLMRIMRGSGARGLAGLYAHGAVVRPFVQLRRATLEAYLVGIGVRWIDDPSNASREFFRNRVRHDLLPALRRADPAIDRTLLDIARGARDLRQQVEAFATAQLRPEVSAGRRLVVASAELTGYDRDSLAVLWSSLAGRVGLALDRRGTRRITEFTISGPRRGRIPLAGGWCLEATRTAYIIERSRAQSVPATLPMQGERPLIWGRFRFRVSRAPVRSSPWTAAIAAPACGLVRAWSAGDRLEPAGGQPRRRVSRYLSDVHLTGSERDGWPVVVAGNDVVWIPGVRRSDAATDRSGRPVLHYVCERIDR
jgi:tRNA(Ile)-lysidine synthase